MKRFVPANALKPTVLVLSVGLLAACENTRLGDAVSGFLDRPAEVPVNDPPQNANGVISYPDFKVIVARDGDTISDLAGRVGLQDVVLARYNGLPLNYILRGGDRLALPEGAQVDAVQQGWTPEVVTGALDRLPDGPAAANPPAPGGRTPIRHNVEPGETAFSIARLYGVSVTALASWNGLDSDLTVAPGRSLLIPSSIQNAPDTVAEDPVVNEPGVQTDITPPPSAANPLPENEDVVVIPEGPNLAEDRTPPAPTVKMRKPVDGTVLRPYSAAPGRSKNDGIDYATAKGAAVRASAAGDVALVSPSVGLGQIILIRHADNLITVYGRLSSDVKVKKGDKVRAGQIIGTVEDGDPPSLHFEIRRGTEAIDPTPFL